nr:MAG TPA: terminase small subunit [Caudoviricetes sp.]
MKLTEKQQRFVDFYIETGNASEAARKAGYSEKTCRVTGQENLQKPAIKSAIGKTPARTKKQPYSDAQ